MEKKNTMLLTVIAVATLLVAVVGATFAFFSLQVSGNSTTDATVTAAKVGTATISTVTENAKLKLSLTADNMAKYEENKVYYASVSGEAPGSATPLKIATMDYKGGEEGTTYNCPVQTEVSVSGSMYDVLVEKWTQLILQGDAVSISAGQSGSSVPGTTIEPQAPEGAERKATYKGTVKVTGPDMDAKDILSASLSLTNLANTDQSVIANKDLVVTIAVKPDGACTLETD